jgi:WXG100 family type VII secretion target
MAAIKLTPEILEEKADSLTQTAQRNDEVVNRLLGLIDALNADWEGDAYNAFKASFDAKKATFKSFTQDMEIFVKFLKKFANMMREEEKRLTTVAQQLGG